MSLINASWHAVNRNPAVRSSYTEISRFFRLRYCKNTPNCLATCVRKNSRLFSTSRISCDAIEPSEQLLKTLEEFKATIRPTSWDTSNLAFDINQISMALLGKEIEIFGYLSTRRDVNKNLSFTIIRNQTQTLCIQLVSSPQSEGEKSDAHSRIRSLREWTPVVVRGRLMARQPAKDDTYLGMRMVNDREIAVEHVQALNEIPNEIIIKGDTVFGPEQRHLQLRTGHELRENLLFRAKANSRARSHLAEMKWKEIETPILFRSTPEGAREFLVPTRQKGLAYALPQSPQQYKQVLMASGITKYFQFARCFRDEDLRADRQPEFTQLDMEMAFAGEEEIMNEIGKLLRALWYKVLKLKFPPKIPRLTYQEAMASYGSDKPDLRCKSKIYSIIERLPPDLPGKMTTLQNPVIDAFSMSISGNPETTRKFISEFLDSPEGKPYLENPDGQPAVFVYDITQPMSGLGTLGYEYIMEEPPGLKAEHGSLLILQARRNVPFSDGSTVLGNLRLALHKAATAKGHIPPPSKQDFEPVWITDFPMFTPSTDTDPGQGGASGFSSTHHPFTAPKTPQDVDLLLTSPSSAIAAHYDIVINGVELGGGSRRIHNAAMQEFIFRDILKMKPDRIEDFRHLLDVLRSGCPPHAGIALGWDRLVALMCGKESVRDVIAFPKSGRGEDLLVKSPNVMTEEQLDTYHLRVKE